MSFYHQGPALPVSSSPIRPLDVQPTCSRHSSPLSSNSRLALPRSSQHLFNLLPAPSTAEDNGRPTSHSTRSNPSSWTPDSSAIFDTSKWDSQKRQSSQGVTALSGPLSNATPIGWDVPMTVVPYAPSPQHSNGGNTTFFYRSPTPNARQRTNQACEKCRDRKTKCSGGRPACTRCQSRGLMCEYAIEHRVRGPAKMRRRDVPLVLSPSSGLQAQKTFAHPYAPPALSVPSRWNPSAIPSKDMGLSAGKRMAWPLSDQSDTSSDSSGAASYEQPSDKMYQELNNTRGMNPTSQRHPQSINYPNDRFKGIMHYPPGDTKEQLLLAPILRLPQSLPQFKPLSFQHRGANDSLGSSPSTSYSASSDLSKPFTLLSSSQGSFSSRCPSPDSSRTSQNCSCSDGPQRHLASKTLGFEDTTSMLENSMSTHSRNEDGLHKAVSATEAEAEIPRSSSQSFNVSEWITVADCSSSPDHKYSSAESATPES